MANILGIDLGNESVRATLANVAAKRVEILEYREIARTPSTTSSGSAESLRQAISELRESLSVAPDRVIVALDGSVTSLRTIELPKATIKHAANVLPFELEGSLPTPLEETLIDYQPIDANTDTARLLVAAAPRNKIRNYLNELAGADLSPREMAVGAAALDGLINVVPELSIKDRPVMILNVNAERTELCVLRNGTCDMARTCSAGIQNVADGTLESTLMRTLSAYRATGAPAVEKIYLGGEVAHQDGASAWFEHKLSIPTELLLLPEAIGADERSRPRFAASTALAARTATRNKRINFCSGDFAPTSSGGTLREHGRLIGICLAAVIASICFSIAVRWSTAKSEHEALETKLHDVTKEAFRRPTRSASKARRMLEGKDGSSNPLPEFDAFDALAAISSSIPTEIRHDTRRLTIELDDDGLGGRFDLRGSVESVAHRDEIAAALTGHSCFTDVQKGTTTPGKRGVGHQLPS